MSKKVHIQPKNIFLDTSFIINLLDQRTKFHEQAYKFYKQFKEQGCNFFISTIVISEYTIKGDVSDLLLDDWFIIPFKIEHAIKSADLYRSYLSQKSEFNQYKRVCLKNDIKILGQTIVENYDYILTADNDFENFVKNLSLPISIINILSTDFHKLFNIPPGLFE